MKKNYFFHIVSCGLLLAFMTGCASVPLRPKEDDLRAKNFQPIATLSRIYVYREKAFAGSALKFPLSLDGLFKGELAPGVFHVFDVAPGHHELFCAGSINATLPLSTDANVIYFVRQDLSDQGLSSPGCMLTLVDNKTGEAAVKKCSLAQSRP